jgi:hypothetical protein
VNGRAMPVVDLCHMSAVLGYDLEQAAGYCVASVTGGSRAWVPEGALPAAGESNARAPLISLQPASPTTNESSEPLTIIPSGIRAYDHIH